MTTKPIDLSQFANATPGPWWVQSGFYTVVKSPEGNIAGVCHGGRDARLIAAAPALAKELQHVREILRGIQARAAEFPVTPDWLEGFAGHYLSQL